MAEGGGMRPEQPREERHGAGDTTGQEQRGKKDGVGGAGEHRGRTAGEAWPGGGGKGLGQEQRQPRGPRAGAGGVSWREQPGRQHRGSQPRKGYAEADSGAGAGEAWQLTQPN